MRDAIGSVFNLALLFTFLLIVTGFILFGVNYYKAFQVKNDLLTLIEKYEGNVDNPKFKDKVKDVINRYGYNPSPSAMLSAQKQQSQTWNCDEDVGWCYRYIAVGELDRFDQYGNENRYYDVMTFVSTDIPVINRIMAGFDFFKVTGRTKPIRIR